MCDTGERRHGELIGGRRGAKRGFCASMFVCWCRWGPSSGKENTDGGGRREGIAGAQSVSPDSVRDWRGWSCREPGQFARNSGEKAECLDVQVGGSMWKFACDSSQLSLLGTLAEAPSVTGPDPVPSRGTSCISTCN